MLDNNRVPAVYGVWSPGFFGAIWAWKADLSALLTDRIDLFKNSVMSGGQAPQ